MSEKEKRVLIFGGSSFTGTWIARSLFYCYDFVMTYFNNEEVIDSNLEYSWHKCCVGNSDIREIINNNVPDVVINLIGGGEPDPTVFSLNLDENVRTTSVKATSQLTYLAKKTNFFSIYLSSDQVFDGQHGPYAEDSRPAPVTEFGKLKYELEKQYYPLIRDKKAAIIRASILFGYNRSKYQRKNILEKLRSSNFKSEPLEIINGKFRTYSHVINLAFLIHRLIENDPVPGIFHVPGVWLSEKEFVESVFMILPSLKTSYNLLEVIDSNYPKKLGIKFDETQAMLRFKHLTLEESLHLPVLFE